MRLMGECSDRISFRFQTESGYFPGGLVDCIHGSILDILPVVLVFKLIYVHILLLIIPELSLPLTIS